MSDFISLLLSERAHLHLGKAMAILLQWDVIFSWIDVSKPDVMISNEDSIVQVPAVRAIQCDL